MPDHYHKLSWYIRKASEKAKHGTTLNALTGDQITTITRFIENGLKEDGLEISEVKPIDQRITDLEESVRDIGKAYGEAHSELALARGLIDMVKDILPQDRFTQDLLADINPPDGEDQILLHMVKNKPTISTHFGKMLKDIQS